MNTIHVRAHLHFHIPTLEYIEKAIHKLPTERPGERRSRTSPGPHAHPALTLSTDVRALDRTLSTVVTPISPPPAPPPLHNFMGQVSRLGSHARRALAPPPARRARRTPPPPAVCVRNLLPIHPLVTNTLRVSTCEATPILMPLPLQQCTRQH